jgi:hypothetical protein
LDDSEGMPVVAEGRVARAANVTERGSTLPNSCHHGRRVAAVVASATSPALGLESKPSDRKRPVSLI